MLLMQEVLHDFVKKKTSHCDYFDFGNSTSQVEEVPSLYTFNYIHSICGLRVNEVILTHQYYH